MVYLLNGGLSGGNTSKRVLENGYHCSSLGDTPKFKTRKISAVRDFPQGCGRVALQILLEAQQSVTVVVGEQGDVQSFKATNSPVQYGMQGDILLDDSIGRAAVVADGMDNQGEEKVLDIEPVDIKLPKEMERKSSKLSKEPNGKGTEALVKQLDNVDSLALISQVPEEDVKPSSDTGLSNDWEGQLKDESVPSPKVKFRRRRVSATRDFPLSCGRNVHTLAEEEHLRVASEDKSLFGIEKGGEATVASGEETKEKIEDSVFEGSDVNVSPPNRTSSACVNIYEKDEVSVRKEIVLCEPVRAVNRRASYDVFVSEHTEEFVLVNALTAASHCPWRQGKVALIPDAVSVEVNLRVASEDKSLTGIERGGEALVASGGETKEKIQDNGFEGSGVNVSPPKTSSSVSVKVYKEHEVSVRASNEPVRVVCGRDSNDVFTSEHNEEFVLVNALMAAPHCPWRQGEVDSNPDSVKARGRGNKCKSAWLKKYKAVAKKTTRKAGSSKKLFLKMDSVCEDAHETPGLSAAKDEEEYGEHGAPPQDLPSGCTRDIEVTLPPYGPNSSSGDARNKVRETLRLFQTICRKLLQGEEGKTRPETKRIDLEAVKIMKNKGKDVAGKEHLGAVPGVEVGDEFQYRVELAIVGVHRLYQAGIDYMKQNGLLVAISIVSSGAYADDKEDADSLIYCGQGGNMIGKGKEPEDQKLERGNLALRNSITAKNPVRVIQGFKETKTSDSADSKSKIVTTYVYDGLYTVDNYWQEEGKHRKKVFKFLLKRIPGQPVLAWKEVKKSNKSKVRHGVCVIDITGGKELIPICAVNIIDNEIPPAFSYISKMMYADWSHLLPPQGCDCTGRCSDSVRCPCAQRNGGEIPYNRNGAIVEAKNLVYECGPKCKCPPSCYNRVSQHGIKLPLEIFKTETRGWGVRSLTSIPSGTFICEYVGELLEDKEAEKRTNDEYLFDIGQNYSDYSLNPDRRGGPLFGSIEEVGYTIDAAYYGNVGRFINHSCSPNLYAQNVLYDHDDKRMPHIMLFAAENIPPLKELTYHYNYSVDQVHDSNGNIKMKSCYCGSSDCIGRLY